MANNDAWILKEKTLNKYTQLLEEAAAEPDFKKRTKLNKQAFLLRSRNPEVFIQHEHGNY